VHFDYILGKQDAILYNHWRLWVMYNVSICFAATSKDFNIGKPQDKVFAAVKLVFDTWKAKEVLKKMHTQYMAQTPSLAGLLSSCKVHM
jgi:hypothetical protein